MVTAKVVAALVPQLLVAFTVIFPPAVPDVALILFVVDVPAQPDPVGKVQIYEVAPATAVIE